MFRTLDNLFYERTKSLDEKLDYPELIELISRLDDFVKINAFCSLAGEKFRWKGIAPIEVTKLLQEEFKPYRASGTSFDSYFVDARHQVYSGEKDAKHYISLEHGECKQLGNAVAKARPFKKATLDFLIELGVKETIKDVVSYLSNARA